MLTMITAAALAAAQPQSAPTAGATAPAPMDHSKMDHAQMDHSKMDHSKMGEKADGCCKKGADGKMECAMSGKAGADSAHQGHSGH
jgi:uncharacterized protein involved in copper resistance